MRYQNKHYHKEVKIYRYTIHLSETKIERDHKKPKYSSTQYRVKNDTKRGKKPKSY